jgi:hypothetical protein
VGIGAVTGVVTGAAVVLTAREVTVHRDPRVMPAARPPRVLVRIGGRGGTGIAVRVAVAAVEVAIAAVAVSASLRAPWSS